MVIATQIPCAHLQLHGGEFASMLSSSHPSNDSPIALDDPVEAFRDFTDMLLTYDPTPRGFMISLISHFSPLHSCIHASHPANEQLGRLLQLLVLCNKYGIREFEEHVLTLVKRLSHPDKLPSNLKGDLTITELMRVASLVNRPEIAEGARTILLDELWGDGTKVPAVARPPYETLLYAEFISDKELISAAYYRLLIS